MASVRNIGLTNEEKKVENENERNDASAMPIENSPNTLNKTPPRDSYWFAHGGIEDASKNAQNTTKPPEIPDPKEIQLQKDKEERIRVFREQQEEDRMKKLKDLEQQFLQAKKHREQQEEERKRRIEEARIRETERRQQVEERKRQIWEAEQERKEAILRRNMEREARIEARRNAQRNSLCFAFGSSTPRTFDLDLAAIGVNRNSASPGSVLMSSVSGRRSEERELGPPRATSACSLDRKFEIFSHDDYSNDQHNLSRSVSLEPSPGRISNLSKLIAMQHKSSNDMKACLSMWDSSLSSRPNYFGSLSPGWLVGSGVTVGEDCMSRSMVSLSSAFRGRKRTDITPTLTRERSITPHVTPRGNCMRAVSMTRLDQLAQPRRPYRDSHTLYSSTTTNNGGPRAISPSMTKSMCNLAIAPAGRRVHAPISNSRRGNMSQSMLHLADTSQKDSRQLTPSPTLPKSGMRSAQSMMHLATAPRLTRTARLRAQALASSRAASAWNLNKPDVSMSGRFMSPGKDTSRSPSRPQSSMSGASELSATSSSISAVNMRTRPAPRRPRPYSIAGSIVDRTPPVVPNVVKKELERQPRTTEKNAQPTVPKQPRAKSVGREKNDSEASRPLSAPKKPVPPPKSKEVLARAKSHPIPPVRDNLRKPVKPTIDSIKANSERKVQDKEKSNVEVKNIQTKVIKSQVESKSDNVVEIVNSSPITSPITDSDMCISSEDSKAVTESEINTYTQTFTESEDKIEASEPEKIEVYKSDKIDVSEPDKIEATEPDKIEATKPDKIEVTKSDKIEATKPDKIEATKPDKIEATKPDKIEGSEPEKIKASEPVNIPCKEQNGYRDVSESENIPKKTEKLIVNSSQEIIQQNVSESENVVLREMTPQKPRITSEEEARAALAEKRRLAREQAEREAELERQRQEDIRRKEEEQRRLEELEQKRMEEEQMRLAELHRQMEAEKLKKAIEEQQQREKEEQEKREEEARQKAEKEEQEKKAREEAEKQRIELEERLRKEEEERAERKRRVEQIMARTRGKAAQNPASTPSENNNKKPEDTNSNSSFEIRKNNAIPPAQDSTKTNHISNGSTIAKIENSSLSTSFTNNSVSSVNPFQISEENMMSNSMPLPDLLNTEFIANHSVKDNGHHVESDEQLMSSKISVSNSFTSNRTLSANDVTSPTQTNGYSSHEDMSCTTSPEETSDAGLLIDVGSSQQNEAKNTLNPADFTKLVDIDQSSLNLTNENYLINVDNVNSNILSSEKSYTGFDDCLQKKPDAPVVDLLS